MYKQIIRLIERHAALWPSDPWYRRAWISWPQALSFVIVGALWFGTSAPNTEGSPAPWGRPYTAVNTTPSDRASANAVPSAPMTVHTGSSETSQNAQPAFQGRVFSNSVPAAGFEVPLPEGPWTGLASVPIKDQNATGIAYFLVRLDNGRMTGAVRVFAAISDSQPGTGFRRFSDCDNENNNNIFTQNDGCTAFESQALWRIHNSFSAYAEWADRTVNMSELDRRAGKALIDQKIGFPQDFLSLQFVRAEKWGLLQADYLFSPDAEGISSKTVSNFRASDWHSSNIVRFPEKMAYAHKLRDWGKLFWPTFKAAFSAGEPSPSTR